MKRIVQKLLATRGYQLSRIRDSSPLVGTMETALGSLAEKHRIGTIIDIGASDGIWSRLALKYYPNSAYLLIEANPVHEPALRQFVLANRNAQFLMAAAGDKHGEGIHFSFDPDDRYGGQASHRAQSDSVVLPAVTVDHEIRTRDLVGPYLLKLDTHGFEVPIFRGASETLKMADVIIIECYNFRISPECLLFPEMCEYLDGLGFRCIDLVDPLWRPYDQAFWQMDLVFIRKDRPEFSYLGYR